MVIEWVRQGGGKSFIRALRSYARLFLDPLSSCISG